MAHYICNGNGDSADAPSAALMREFLDGLEPEDEEHGAAWVADDLGNSLEYEVGGNLCFSRDGVEPRHLSEVSKERVIELWLRLVEGGFEELERESWQPGTRPLLSSEARATRERSFADAQLAADRKFYSILGEERPSAPCRVRGCARGSVSLSVFCRRHHFESILNRPCPFEVED